MKYITAFFGFVALVFGFLFQRQKAEKLEEDLEREETAREYERAGAQALIGGLENEQKPEKEVKRGRFT